MVQKQKEQLELNKIPTKVLIPSKNKFNRRIKMEKYLSLLIEQFKQANNIKNVDINSQVLYQSFQSGSN